MSYGCVPIERLVREGRISRYSQKYLLSKELGIKVLPVEKSGKIHFSSTEFAEIVDAVTRKFQISSVLDLFSGSGALSKIAILNRVKKITCVDIFTKAIKINLLQLKNRLEIVESDILGTKFDKFYDVVISDTPSALLVDVSKKVLPYLNTDLLIMYYGGKGNIRRDRKIEMLCKKLFKKVLIVQNHGLKHICCTSTSIGNKYIAFLEKKFYL